jgi:glyoxylase-like metal-dependent hydrolase (beta-lactamase superfamily II)
VNDQIRPIDVRHLGRERVICAWQVGDVLVDPGPASGLDTLLAAIADPPRALALTHIHLDHAGAAGSLVARWPTLEVWVHERGARHLVDPERLLASARRLYGPDMDRLWGEVRPVPAENLRVLSESGPMGPFRYAYTPGHASHHVSYLHEDSGVAFTGDVAGVRITPADHVLPPTPPPDIDLEAWRRSLAVVRDWAPARLAVTHFGAFDDVARQLDAVDEQLSEQCRLAEDLELEDFVAAVRSRVRAATDPETAAAYDQAAPPEQLWQGLRRYLQTLIRGSDGA